VLLWIKVSESCERPAAEGETQHRDSEESEEETPLHRENETCRRSVRAARAHWKKMTTSTPTERAE
jgi:hypothetical protein